jgi:hypothetical protein
MFYIVQWLGIDFHLTIFETTFSKIVSMRFLACVFYSAVHFHAAFVHGGIFA